MRSLSSALLLTASAAMSAPTPKPVTWELDGVPYEGVLIADPKGPARPGLVMFPNWLGVTPEAVAQGTLVASRGYVVLVADVYGAKRRPKDRDEAGKASGALKAGRKELRARAEKALEVLRAQPQVKLEANKLAAIGFCFGGTAALELGRAGAKVAALVSFHGGLSSPTPDDARNIVGKVLALHGADDPSVPPDEVAAFQAEMRAAKVDWRLVSFGNTVHSFTDPGANLPGRAQYHPVVAARAYALMDDWLREAFSSPK